VCEDRSRPRCRDCPHVDTVELIGFAIVLLAPILRSG